MEATKTCVRCKQTKSVSEFYKHDKMKDGRHSWCRQCMADRANEQKLLPKIVPTEKACTRCRATKAIDEFNQDKRTIDGRTSHCKACYRNNGRYQYVKNKERRLEDTRRWRAENKERYIENSRRWYDKNREYIAEVGRKWREENKERYHEKNRKWRAENKERIAETVRKWAKANPDRIATSDRRRKARKHNAQGSHTPEQFRALINHYGNHCLCCGKQCKLTADHVVPLNWGGSNDIGNIQGLCLSCNCAKSDHHATDYRPDGGAFARQLA